MCTQKVPYCYMPINIFVIALLKNMNLVCPVIAAFAEISTSFNTKLTHTLITNRYKFFVMLINRKCPKSEVLGIYRLTYRRFLSILKIINP